MLELLNFSNLPSNQASTIKDGNFSKKDLTYSLQLQDLSLKIKVLSRKISLRGTIFLTVKPLDSPARNLENMDWMPHSKRHSLWLTKLLTPSSSTKLSISNRIMTEKISMALNSNTSGLAKI